MRRRRRAAALRGEPKPHRMSIGEKCMVGGLFVSMFGMFYTIWRDIKASKDAAKAAEEARKAAETSTEVTVKKMEQNKEILSNQEEIAAAMERRGISREQILDYINATNPISF